MALYWPDQKVAIDILDDPNRRPFEGGDDWTVLEVSTQDLCVHERFVELMGKLCTLLDMDMPPLEGPKAHESACDPYALHSSLVAGASLVPSLQELLPNPVRFVVTGKTDVEKLVEHAKSVGVSMSDIEYWGGPVPEGSFEALGQGMQMATAPYFFLRRANELPLAEAVRLGIELCGKYRTHITQYDADHDSYDFLREPRVTKAELAAYLRNVSDTREGTRALRVLRRIIDRCASPMACFLYLMLCLPRALGSYGLSSPAPLLSAVFKGEGGFFVPAASGPYLAYDLIWRDQLTAAQYVGECEPDATALEALRAEGMRVVCFTDADVEDAERFDVKARELARLLGIDVPAASALWFRHRASLRRSIEVPRYPNQRLISGEIASHLADW